MFGKTIQAAEVVVVGDLIYFISSQSLNYKKRGREGEIR